MGKIALREMDKSVDSSNCCLQLLTCRRNPQQAFLFDPSSSHPNLAVTTTAVRGETHC